MQTFKSIDRNSLFVKSTTVAIFYWYRTLFINPPSRLIMSNILVFLKLLITSNFFSLFELNLRPSNQMCQQQDDQIMSQPFLRSNGHKRIHFQICILYSDLSKVRAIFFVDNQRKLILNYFCFELWSLCNIMQLPWLGHLVKKSRTESYEVAPQFTAETCGLFSSIIWCINQYVVQEVLIHWQYTTNQSHFIVKCVSKL